MKNCINWGFVGCGKVVEKKSGEAFNNIENSSIYAIMRRDIDKARISAKRFGAKKWYDNIDDLLNDDNIDAIYISTPPGMHYEHAIACAQAKKPTYIEKPFARNYTEAKKIVEAFKSNEIPLFVAHYRRALPKFIMLKKMIEAEEIGKVLEVDFRMTRTYDKNASLNTWLYDASMSGGGKFFDIAPHTIDIIIFLFGNFVDISGFTCNNNSDYAVEDMVTFSFKTERNIIGSANFNCLSNVKGDRMIVYGTKGKIEFSIHGNDKILITNRDKNKEIIIDTPEYIQHPMIETVVEELLGKGECPCKGEEALKTAKAIDSVLDEFYNGRSDEFWNRIDSWNK